MATTATMTGAQFDALPYEEGQRWELINGELITVSSPTPRHQIIVSRTLITFVQYLETSKTEGLSLPDVEFALTPDDRVRPDVCVVLGEKASRLDRDRIPIPFAPDLAVEIISQWESASESHEKVRRYLLNGTSEVWQLYPKSRTVQTHRRDITREVEPDGFVETELLAGLRIPVASLFA
jgi:Uma2 family endonuclease